MTWLPGDAAQPPQVAYAVGRRAGGAVVRNQLRRRLRAAVRDARALLQPGAYLVGASAEATAIDADALRGAVREALAAATVAGDTPS